ncbi:Kunitz/Bovine pancreatic trypsin inhibitor domain protein [Necator americanus]|uniref:Kunitz/Bovine pancreatic trypsin inhibitor domain protein n=1 Tax=Necator americanus TaxID=51031 RepID=W2T0Z1_NECAM|nr:Kunitz/Bovine pancreatic trypsin inhibitor domain protein [Necator americanus]ETN75229.1 Kunitz/Bovine pancreatic trypsin inhibitor domain protein [Necator americanus]
MIAFLFGFLCLTFGLNTYSYPSSGNVCDLDLETGPCLALFQKYGFNKTAGECVQFTYGGCDGNGNRFDTIAECQKRCPNNNPSC